MRFIKILITFIFLLVISFSLFASENNKQYFKGIGLYESLYSAIEMDSVNEIRQFIIFGADINHRYANGKTPLMLAASFGNLKSVQTLIELGADIQLKSDNGNTALDYARSNKKSTTLAALQSYTIPQQTQSKRQMVTTIQFYLNRLGYVAGDLDGVYGKKTRNSLKQFSKDSNQLFPAEISERQIEALFNTMSGNDVAETEKPEFIVDPEKENYVETIPAETTEELVISETGPNSAIR